MIVTVLWNETGNTVEVLATHTRMASAGGTETAIVKTRLDDKTGYWATLRGAVEELLKAEGTFVPDQKTKGQE